MRFPRYFKKVTYDGIIAHLLSKKNPANIAGMARFGISSANTLGISMKDLRAFAKTIPRNHELALRLWDSGIHEARILAGIREEPKAVTPEQMEKWVGDFDSWDVCDQVCMNLFDRTPYARQKAIAWSSREEEFVKRAGFAMMASLAVHDRHAPDTDFDAFLDRIIAESDDPRNFVRKAVNWALRQIGKRNPALCTKAIAAARVIARKDSKTARWIARDALRELEPHAILHP
jgi:3-methyladenine DNA glycosylase AlkD